MAASEIDPQPKAPWQDSTNGESGRKRTVIGKPPNNHWMHSAYPATFDLTRPSPPDFPLPSPSSSVTMQTTTTPIIISPRLSALVIVDMQNFFLSTALSRAADSAGNKAQRQLLEHAIPAARKAGIRIIWLNWGLTDEDLDGMPPSVRRAFGFEASLNQDDTVIDKHGVNEAAANSALESSEDQSNANTTTAAVAKVDSSELNENGKPKRLYRGLGSEIGPVNLEDGTTMDGGRLLFRSTWNAGLSPELDAAWKEGQSANPPDVWIHKNRMSGLWGASTPCTEFLEKEGIRTLLFTGVNTDQCVGGSLQDAYAKGYDCILLSDGCGTTSPAYAQQCMEYNVARTWGFLTDCEAFAKGVEGTVGELKA